uniref:Uncharacterized protein n=1 Tax=Caenorhabditis japonica TaxID=281687 RepID=A0A8R1I644_CAEJA
MSSVPCRESVAKRPLPESFGRDLLSTATADLNSTKIRCVRTFEEQDSRGRMQETGKWRFPEHGFLVVFQFLASTALLNVLKTLFTRSESTEIDENP